MSSACEDVSHATDSVSTSLRRKHCRGFPYRFTLVAAGVSQLCSGRDEVEMRVHFSVRNKQAAAGGVE